MSHDTEPEDVKLVSIVEREAEEAYPVQYWDGSDIKKTFEADSDDLQEAYVNYRDGEHRGLSLPGGDGGVD